MPHLSSPTHPPILPLPQAPGNHWFAFCLWVFYPAHCIDVESYNMWPLVPASFTWLPFSRLTRVVACVGTSFLLLNGVSWRGCGWGAGNATQIRRRTSKLTLFEQETDESNRSFWKLI